MVESSRLKFMPKENKSLTFITLRILLFPFQNIVNTVQTFILCGGLFEFFVRFLETQEAALIALIMYLGYICSIRKVSAKARTQKLTAAHHQLFMTHQPFLLKCMYLLRLV